MMIRCFRNFGNSARGLYVKRLAGGQERLRIVPILMLTISPRVAISLFWMLCSALMKVKELSYLYCITH